MALFRGRLFLFFLGLVWDGWLIVPGILPLPFFLCISASPAGKNYFLPAVPAGLNLVIVAQVENEFLIKIVEPVSAGFAVTAWHRET